MTVPSITLHIGSLWCWPPASKSPYALLPIERLQANMGVHGEFWVVVQGRIVPRMGYVTPDDKPRDGVSIAEWYMYFAHVVTRLTREENKTVSFADEDSMDGPVYEFMRGGESVYLSLSYPRDGLWAEDGDVWNMVEFAWPDFTSQVAAMKAEFLRRIEMVNPSLTAQWQTLLEWHER